MQKNKNIAVIDLFCGIGGLSQGFVMENLNVISGYDNDISCKFTYETNNNAIFHTEDVSKLSGETLNKEFGKNIKVLVGCAPCQPFSSYSFKVKKKDENKLNLLYSFSRLIEETQPTIVSMENVPQLVDFNKFTIFKDFYDKLKSLGYFVSYKVVFCPDYGIPQRRRRLVLLASKLGEISLIPETHTPDKYVTVKDTISNLKPVKAGEYDTNDPLHRARKLSGLNHGRFGHPEQDRAITLREAALFQTFPMNYRFFESLDKYNPSIICRQIGNAVPPKLGQVIAKSIKNHLKEYNLW
ncbi:MAG: DNA (cytosine-5-)-methyltransferase [Dysgonamonadaceae bacterium]|jgi:DNA (cytosine-5)-methyltransferase 1|nr:DNA (cytosine-5-)-methyltransferase [Dysgonamonadaceae bacterium]